MLPNAVAAKHQHMTLTVKYNKVSVYVDKVSGLFSLPGTKRPAVARPALRIAPDNKASSLQTLTRNRPRPWYGVRARGQPRGIGYCYGGKILFGLIVQVQALPVASSSKTAHKWGEKKGAIAHVPAHALQVLLYVRLSSSFYFRTLTMPSDVYEQYELLVCRVYG